MGPRPWRGLAWFAFISAGLLVKRWVDIAPYVHGPDFAVLVGCLGILAMLLLGAWSLGQARALGRQAR